MLAEISRAIRKTTGHLHWQFFGTCKNPVRICHGITGRQHLIDLRRTALLNEQYEESKKEHQLYCYSQDCMRNGSPIPLKAVAIGEMSKTSLRMGKLLIKGDSENHLKVPQCHLEHWWNIFQSQHVIKWEFINMERKYCQESFWNMHWSLGDRGKTTFWLQI